MLATAVVDLDVARLGPERRPGDVHRLPPRGDRVRYRLGEGHALRARALRPAADLNALDAEAGVRIDGRRLLDCLLAPEHHGDLILRAATAVDTVICTSWSA